MNSKPETQTFSIRSTKAFEKSLRRLQKVDQARISKAIEKISIGSNFQSVKALVGNLMGFYSLRVGDYRLILRIDFEKRTAVLVDVGHRREIYD